MDTVGAVPAGDVLDDRLRLVPSPERFECLQPVALHQDPVDSHQSVTLGGFDAVVTDLRGLLEASHEDERVGEIDVDLGDDVADVGSRHQRQCVIHLGECVFVAENCTIQSHRRSGIGFHTRVPHHLSGRGGPPEQHLCLVRLAAHPQPVGAANLHPRPFGTRRLGGDDQQRSLDDVVETGRARIPRVEGELVQDRTLDERVTPFGCFRGEPAEFDGPVEVPGEVSGAGGASKQLQVRAAGQFVRLVDPAPDVEGSMVGLARLGHGADRFGGRRRRDRGAQRLGKLGGGDAESGDLAEVFRPVSLQRGCGSGEQRGALAREQLVEEDLPHEVVTEAKADLGLVEEALTTQLVDGRLITVEVELAGFTEHQRVDGCGEGGGRLDAADRVGSQGLAARQHHVADPGRRSLTAEAGGHDLLGVERIAATAT